MIFSKLQKFIIAVMIVSVSMFTFQPKPAQALFGFDFLNAAIQVVGHGIQGALLGVDGAANTFSAGLQSVRQVLDGLPIEYGPARKALSAATASCEVLGGNFFAAQTLVDITNGNTTPSSTVTSIPASQTTSHESIHALPTVTTGATPATTAPASLSDLASSLSEIGDQTKANLSLVIGQKLSLLKHRQTCYSILTSSIQSALLVGGWNEQLKQAFQDSLAEINGKVNPVNSQIGDLTKQQISAKQDIFKAIAASVAQQTNEANTEATVDDLKPKLTVGSYSKVTDAVSKQVYAAEAIKKNYDNDKPKQLIMTQLLDAEIAPDKAGKDQAIRSAQSLVEAQVRSNPVCKQAYENGDYTPEDIIQASSLVINPDCDFGKVFSSTQEEFNKLLADSKASAQNEVTTGGGFLSTRACVDVSDKQKQVAITTAQAAKNLQDAILTRVGLENAGQFGNNSAYIDAVNQEKNAIAAMNAVPSQVNGGINPSCGPITDAGGLIKTALDNYINQWMTQGLLGSNSTNQPLNAQFASTIVSKLFGGLLLNPKQAHNVFSEIGASFLNAILKGSLINTSTTGATNTQINVTPSQVSVHELPHASTTPSSSSSTSSSSTTPNGTVNTPLSTTPTVVLGASTDVPVSAYFSPRSSSGILGAR